MKKNVIIISICIAMLAMIFGIMIGRFSATTSSAEKKPLYWVDSMEPQIQYPAPGKSRMGMELTPVYAKDQLQDQSSVQINSTLVNNLGVRLATVSEGTFDNQVNAVGYVEPNENKITHIHSYADGWIKKLLVKTVGESVKENQILLQFYSPVLVNAQEEYLIALGSGDQSLINASIKKLQSLHVSQQQIQQLQSTKKSSQLIDIYSPQNGVVTVLNVREGMRVTPDVEMMSLVDLSSIWMIAEIYEEQAGWVNIGEEASAKLSAFPGKVWRGEVEYIYPQVDPTTRTIKVRFRFANPDNTLKPNMYADITLHAEPKANVLSIPLEAIIRSSQGDRVIVSLGEGRFQARAVTVGDESDDKIQIISGLKAGEKIVVSGQFLIDSETNLESGLQRLSVDSDDSEKSTKDNHTAMIGGKGLIKSIDKFKHSITLQHEAIPALNWPEMIMSFSVMDNIDLNQFKVGDSVQFSLQKTEVNRYVITKMTVLTK